MSGARWQTVIGLEIHVQLATRSKLFCGNAAEYGAPPNTHLCPVCLGLPGSLPVVNARAVELAVRAALALGCTVHPRSAFARKHYLYPDLPKGYQITQHERPLATGGAMNLGDAPEAGARRVRIRRVHLEEDTGRSLHDRVEGCSGLDLNRAGVPLIEIVTEPDLRSPAEARVLLGRLKQLLLYLEVSDCNMEQGSLRVDANLSLRRSGQPPRGRSEVKNLNSFSQVERALRWEARRQAEVLEAGGEVLEETLLWDAGAGKARVMRAKEASRDYRYLPEPDLPELQLPETDGIRASLPEAPWDRQARLQREHGLPPAHARPLTATRELADFYEGVVRAGANAREAAGWVLGEVLAACRARGVALPELGVAPGSLAELLAMTAGGALPRPLARRVLERMIETGRRAAEVVEEEGIRPVREEGALEGWVDQVVAASPAEVERYRAGERKLLGFLVGQVMRASAGRGDPVRIAAALRARLEG